MISIITATYNAEKTIENTLKSVLNQKFPNIEHIIIDGNSADNTINIVKKYQSKFNGRLKWISEPDKGIYDAMNKGISLASGDWIYFMGGDDVFYNDDILSDIFSYDNYIDFDVIYGSVKFLTSGRIYDREFDPNKFCNTAICHQAIFYRKNVFEQFGYYNLEYKINADHVFNSFVYSSNITKWKYIDKVIAIFNDTGVSSNKCDKLLKQNSFQLRYELFKPYISDYTKSRIFFSSFLYFALSHRLSVSTKYLVIFLKDIGVIRLTSNAFKIIKHKISAKYCKNRNKFD